MTVKKEKKKEYELPQSLKDKFTKYQKYYTLKEKYIKEDASYRKIKRVAAKAERLRHRFWVQVGYIHPDLIIPKGKTLYFDIKKGLCVIKEKINE